MPKKTYDAGVLAEPSIAEPSLGASQDAVPADSQDTREGEVSLGQLFNLTPEVEREMEVDKDRFVTKGMKLIHSPKSRDQLITSFRFKNPIESVANIATSVLNRLDEVSGRQVHDVVKIGAGIELIEQIIEIGELSGKLPPLSPEEKQTALSVTVEKYIGQEIAAGRINKDALAETMGQGIQGMNSGQQQDLDTQLKSINRTAMGSSMETVGTETSSPGIAAAGTAVQETAPGVAPTGEQGLLGGAV